MLLPYETTRRASFELDEMLQISLRIQTLIMILNDSEKAHELGSAYFTQPRMRREIRRRAHNSMPNDFIIDSMVMQGVSREWLLKGEDMALTKNYVPSGEAWKWF